MVLFVVVLVVKSEGDNFDDKIIISIILFYLGVQEAAVVPSTREVALPGDEEQMSR